MDGEGPGLEADHAVAEPVLDLGLQRGRAVEAQGQLSSVVAGVHARGLELDPGRESTWFCGAPSGRCSVTVSPQTWSRAACDARHVG